MEETWHRCSKSGDGNSCVKNGKTSDGRQRYKCKVCGKRFLKSYIYKPRTLPFVMAMKKM